MQTRARCSDSRPALALLVVLQVALLLLGSLVVVGSVTPTLRSTGGAQGAQVNSGVRPFVTNNVSYTSSVDGFQLSYLETLPSGYAGAPAPLVVYLHGLGSSTQNISGGTGGNTAPGQLLANASTAGYIVIAPNTRSSAGYYANTPCGGPQQTDIVDAINAEETARSITAVYFVGFSGGSAGAFSLVGNHKVTAKGIATAGTITDFFQTFAFNVNRNDLGHYNAYVADNCGKAPSATNHSSAAVAYSLSPFRFYPQNFTAVQLYVAAGGLDTEAPSNYSAWSAYSNVNSTFRTPTCKIQPSFGEPPSCTQSYANLTPSTTSKWLDLYELKATHVATQINYGALFQFWGNVRIGGFYVSPVPTVTISPISFAWQAFPQIAQHLMGCGSSTGAAAAAVPVQAGQTIVYMVALNQTTAITVSTVVDTVGDTFHFIHAVTNAGQTRVELWVVNNSLGLSTNRVTGTWSATDRFCFWEVVVANSRNWAPLEVVGAGTTGNNVTTSDGFTSTSGRSLILTLASSALATTYTTLGAVRAWDQANSSTVISAAGEAENQSNAGPVLPQTTISTGKWAALSVAIQQAPVPAAPTALTVTKTTTTTISLSWSNPSGAAGTGLLNLTIVFGSTCGTWTSTFSIGGVTTATTLGGFQPGSPECFAIGAWNTTGESVLSSTASTTTNGTGGPVGTVPAAPTALEIVNVTVSTVSLVWTAPPGGGILNWTLYQGFSCGTWTAAYSLGATSVTFALVYGLSASTSFCFAVAAWNVTGESHLSNQVAATTLKAGVSTTQPGALAVAPSFPWDLLIEVGAFVALVAIVVFGPRGRGGPRGPP